MTKTFFRPNTTALILSQLDKPLLLIPDPNTWTASSIEPGHKIGKAAYLFSNIKPEKETEWRELFGGDEARKAKEEKARKAAAKKAEKERKKAKKAAGKEDVGKGVESAEKGAVEGVGGGAEKEAVESVAEGVKQVTLQSS